MYKTHQSVEQLSSEMSTCLCTQTDAEAYPLIVCKLYLGLPKARFILRIAAAVYANRVSSLLGVM